MCSEVVHLHGHTKYSLRDSTSTPSLLAARAVELGYKAIAVTDHGIASSWVDMTKACKQATLDKVQSEIAKLEAAGTEVTEAIQEDLMHKHELKFIPGCEMYETDDRTVQTQKEMNAIGVTEYNGYHFLMIVKNNEGLVNLQRIISDASLNGQFNGRNRTDLKTIRQNGWGKGIIATSACLAGRVAQYILEGRHDDAKDFALECADIFDEFYLELQDNGVKDQYVVNQGVIQLSKDTGLPVVMTGDYHYVDLKDMDMHDNWVCIGRSAEKDHTKNKYDGGPYHLKSKEEMWNAIANGIPEEALHNTVKIAEQCDAEIDFSKNRFPKYPYVPVGYTPDSYLHKKAFDALNEYVIEREELGTPIDMSVYIKRMEYELSVISGKGYSDYFLYLDDIFGFCRSKDIYTGPGRGSGAGSLLADRLGITDIDPIENKLLFERFLNPERKSAPDEYLIA